MNMTILELAGSIADLKGIDYKNTLAISTLIELCIAKGVFTREEFTTKAMELEQLNVAEIVLTRRQRQGLPANNRNRT